MKTAWVVQANVEPESTSPGLLRHACAPLNLPFHEVAVTPGQDELPKFPNVGGPVVFHGRSTMEIAGTARQEVRLGVNGGEMIKCGLSVFYAHGANGKPSVVAQRPPYSVHDRYLRVGNVSGSSCAVPSEREGHVRSKPDAGAFRWTSAPFGQWLVRCAFESLGLSPVILGPCRTICRFWRKK